MAGGYIKLYRSVSANPLWLEQKFTPGQAWVDLLMLANYRDGHIRVRGNKVRVKRGQVGWSVVRLSERWNWGRAKVIRFLNELENDGQIVQQKKRLTSLLTIVNYEMYQRRSTTERTTDNATDSTTDGTQTVQQTAHRQRTNKKNKEFKEQQTNDSGETEPLSEAWSSVVVFLESEGMDFATAACEKARANGNTVDEVMALAKHWQNHKPAWDIGTLYYKICGLKEGRRVNWPQPSDEYKKIQADAKQKQQAEKAVDSRKKQLTERKNCEARAAELEATFGARLDAMSKEEIMEILDEHFPMAKALFRDVPCTGSVRKSMLVHLESVAKQPFLCIQG